MKDYCIDTSGLTEPLQRTPEDLYPSLWAPVKNILASGRIAVTKEIFDEMVVIDGTLGSFIESHKNEMLLEIGGDWSFHDYINTSVYLQEQYRDFISENNGNIKGTVGMNDMSIIALAKTLGLPLVNMEGTANTSPKRKRIPDVCAEIGVQSLTFNEFLRAESITV
ncbi:DUF4411 family protein [Parahaliea maris]|uniref:DUF4411 family protein n=1 Tax=Parahaliea maris TaxID=2716870 RepID=A0A5C8ZMV8_9GAMM|nr:DUF4411 family protein [Parahaliea maris]TXS89070.1 DUF4411 family protein [Parahaliea maris]